ncbi:MAG: hypothetical protein ACTHOR_10595 [Devosia sp.]|jgi:hypothetical protein|nr:hypothetical protein [Devosiaceae bacterium]
MKWALTTAVALLLVTLMAPAAPAAGTKTGRITGFECGDNCYLTIQPSKGAPVTALCAAKACAAWNAATTIPKRLIGKRVRVSIGNGRQYDASGNDMGPFPSFETLEFVSR